MFQKMGPAPSTRYRHTMTTVQNKIFVFGGESGISPKPDEEGIIHILDTCKYLKFIFIYIYFLMFTIKKKKN
jgi:hypothetical protein